MGSISHDDAEPVTDHIHHNSWSANLEKPEHADDRDLVLAQAIDAVNHTASGHHVSVITHANHGHLSEFLFQVLTEEFSDELKWEYARTRCEHPTDSASYITSLLSIT